MAKRFFFVCAGLTCMVGVVLVAPSIGRTTSATVTSSEVAMRSGVLSHGQIIPLPSYSDGTTALESECTWIVSPAFLSTPGSGGTRLQRCDTEGRTVRVYWCYQPECEATGATHYYGQANYLIIALKGGTPTADQQESFGGLKVRYRAEREPQGAKQPTNR